MSHWTDKIVEGTVAVAMAISAFWLIVITVGAAGALFGWWTLCGE